jgi:hypothetical protein
MTERADAPPPADAPTRPPPARGWIYASRALVGLLAAVTLAGTALFLWLAFDPKRDGFGLLAILTVDGTALVGGALAGLAPSLLLDRCCGVRFGRRSQIALLCVVLLAVELAVCSVLHWQSIC